MCLEVCFLFKYVYFTFSTDCKLFKEYQKQEIIFPNYYLIKLVIIEVHTHRVFISLVHVLSFHICPKANSHLLKLVITKYHIDTYRLEKIVMDMPHCFGRRH